MALATNNAFTMGNGFDPNCFYGEDEEGEEEEDGNDDDDAQQQQGWNTDLHNPMGAASKTATSAAPPPPAPTQAEDDGWDGWDDMSKQPSTLPSTAGYQQQQQVDGTLSTNDLLNLFGDFGGGCSGSSPGLEKDNTNNNINNSSNNVVADKVHGRPGHQKTSSKTSGTVVVTAAPEGDFELPAPSDSSSDEED
jgi:hypothetical protein